MSYTSAEQQISHTLVFRLKRIFIVGVAGAGKTTLAKQLALRLGLPYVDLDALYWEANWTKAPPDVFKERVAQALCRPCWVTDGNYYKVRDLTWGQADTVIWLDYSLWIIMRRLLWRTIRHLVTQEELWNGNRATLMTSLLAHDSIIIWALKSYREKRRQYLAAQSDPAYAHLNIIRLHTPRATRLWLSHLPVPEQIPDL